MSLFQQSDPDWNAIVIGDGCKITNRIEDPKITYIEADKQVGGAGIVRNIGLELVTSSWVAFVDDDDFLKDNYVERIKFYSGNYDLIQFSYKDLETGRVQPPHFLNKLVECDMGISFCAKVSFINKFNIRFTPGGIEDYRFLKACLDSGAKYVITHEILYLVGHRSAWGTN